MIQELVGCMWQSAPSLNDPFEAIAIQVKDHTDMVVLLKVTKKLWSVVIAVKVIQNEKFPHCGLVFD